jgi:uncharacterized protein YndB with AHSA1/START domain
MLAVFLDRRTMRHERWYPHPIERVWEAVSSGAHLDAWLVPVCQVDARVGGRCSFSWGGPSEAAEEGEVTVCDPPSAIQYTFGDPRSFLRFDLETDGDGTRLRFTQSFRPGENDDQPDDAYDGADRPAGPDTPWRPGFVAGFHSMLDQLDGYLRGDDRTAEDRHREWIDIYRAHIRDNCPPE